LWLEIRIPIKEVDILDVCGNCKNFGNGCEVTNPDALVNNCNEWEANENSNYMPFTSSPEDIAKPNATNPDNVNHPSHYTQGGIECIKAIEASMTPEGFQDYCKGNVLKYIWRWREKNGVEDLRKASVYLYWMIESAEKEHHDIIGSGEDTQESS
jgi:hypothetical protein